MLTYMLLMMLVVNPYMFGYSRIQEADKLILMVFSDERADSPDCYHRDERNRLGALSADGRSSRNASVPIL